MNLSERVEGYRKLALSVGDISKYIEKEFNNTESLANMIHHSTKIEGNTITKYDTRLILTGIMPFSEASNKYDTREISEINGMLLACRYVYDHLSTKILTEEFLLKTHYHVYNLSSRKDMGKHPGEYRNLEGFTRTTRGTIKHYLNPEMVEEMTQKLIYDYNNTPTVTLDDIINFKLKILQIHPFADGNGRTTRLILNWMLITNGYPPILIKYEDRESYIDGLEEYGRFKDKSKFTKFIYTKLIESYKDMLKEYLNESSDNKIKGFK